MSPVTMALLWCVHVCVHVCVCVCVFVCVCERERERESGLQRNLVLCTPNFMV